MFDISLYPLFFLGKNQNRKVDVPVPSAHPWLSRNMAIGYDEMK